MKFKSLLLVMALAGLATSLTAQTARDSLTQADIIRLTLSNQPQVTRAEQMLAAAEARIDARRASLYPDVAITGLYERIGPVATFDLNNESLPLYPNDNYDWHVQAEQTLYDFGRNRTTIDAARAARQTAGDNIDLVRSNLAYRAVGAFNAVLILQHTVAVIDSQLAALEQHALISTTRIKAGTATGYDTLTTRVRIAVAENDRTDAQRGLESQMIALRQLTGLADSVPLALKGDFAPVDSVPSIDSLLSVAESQRPELVLAHDAEREAELAERMAGLGNRPTISLAATSGIKNGYIPKLSEPKLNYSAGILFNMPIFNGHRTRAEVTSARAAVLAAQEHTADTKRQITGEIRQAILLLRSSLNKLGTADIQIHQAEQALAMADTRYNAGVITNLELLDAQTALLQTRLIRLRALYDYSTGRAALDRATGKRIW